MRGCPGPLLGSQYGSRYRAINQPRVPRYALAVGGVLFRASQEFLGIPGLPRARGLSQALVMSSRPCGRVRGIVPVPLSPWGLLVLHVNDQLVLPIRG